MKIKIPLVLVIILALSMFAVGFYIGYSFGDSRTVLIPADKSINNSVKDNNKATSQKEKNIYQNDKFNFELTLTDAWKNYKAVTLAEKTDFGVGVAHFYLPTEKEQEFTDYPGYLEGYVNLFSISVYNRKAWEDPERDKSFDEMYGEEIAKNDKYVFVYSHLNGDPPVDISRQSVLDMEKIAKSIKTN